MSALAGKSSSGRQPSAPVIGSASAGNGSASVSFSAPSYLGKPPASTYRVFTQPVVVRSTTGTISNAVQINGIWRADVTGMSSVSNLMINQTISATNGTGSLGSGTVLIKSIPTSTSIIIESDSVITNGTISNILGGILGAGSSSPITVTGLTNGVSYTFRVLMAGGENSLPSNASNSVTPVALPVPVPVPVAPVPVPVAPVPVPIAPVPVPIAPPPAPFPVPVAPPPIAPPPAPFPVPVAPPPIAPPPAPFPVPVAPPPVAPPPAPVPVPTPRPVAGCRPACAPGCFCTGTVCAC